MINEAFTVLDAIGNGDELERLRQEGWLEAFKAMRWAVETRDGPALTEAGRQALVQMQRDRKRVR
ncbi:MAG: hypothetical protein P4L73_14140 [Caulobacteraceae bacterium]|nr:hypothetical protein [Caulobacteraceae bacterium]